MKRIILCGCFGKMGRVITQLVSNRMDCEIVAGVDLFEDTADFPTYASLDDVRESADVIIDFSRPELLTDILGYTAEHPGVSAVLCTTGYSAEQVEALKAASSSQPIFYSRNMSLGINLLVELAKKARDEDVQILGTGEMGIGNTTTSTAVLCALTNANPNDVAGRGGGITDEAFARKKTVIQRALDVNKPDSSDVLGVIAKVGGFDIAAMCGVFLGAAQCRLPVVIDGYISMVSALCAKRISSISAGYFIPSHKSKEKGYLLAAEEVGVKPFLDLNMRLGEGSGCPLAFEVVKAACVIMNDMASFNGAGIDDSYLNEIRKQRDF